MNWMLTNHLHELSHMAAATFFIIAGISAIWEYRNLRSNFVLSYSAMCLFSAGYAIHVVISHNLPMFGEFWIPWTTAGLVMTFSAAFFYLLTVGQFLDVQSRLFAVPLILLGTITVTALGDLLLYAAANRSFVFTPVPREGIGPHQAVLGEGAYSLQIMAEILPFIFIVSFVFGAVYLLVHLIRSRSTDILIYIGLSLTAAIIVNESLVALSVYEGVYLLAFTKAFEALRINRDISQRSQAQFERRLHEAEKSELEKRVQLRTSQLEAANKELETFAYSVSHDLRAPLRHIDGFTSLLKNQVQDSLSGIGLEYLNTIAESSRKMGRLIDDLLEFSRTGRMEMSKRTIDLNNLIKKTIEEFKYETISRNIKWKIENFPEIYADSNLLHLVFTNLISNAVKFTRTKKIAKIEIGCLDERENELILFVRDNGVGFDKKYIKKLFGVFQRLHSDKEFEGTGVGLANVRRIINRHGGQTWAEGESGKGAAFYFSLPKL